MKSSKIQNKRHIDDDEKEKDEFVFGDNSRQWRYQKGKMHYLVPSIVTLKELKTIHHP